MMVSIGSGYVIHGNPGGPEGEAMNAGYYGHAYTGSTPQEQEYYNFGVENRHTSEAAEAASQSPGVGAVSAVLLLFGASIVVRSGLKKKD